MMKSLTSLLVALIVIVGFGPVASSAAEPRTAAERDAELAERQQARNIEALSRELERLKKIDLRFQEQYYTRIVPHFDSVSLDIYANFLRLSKRLENIEVRMHNLIYNVLPAREIPFRPQPGVPLPEGVVAFDVEDKFFNAQACLDGEYYSTSNRNNGPKALGNCVRYDIPASGVATTTSGLQKLRAPGVSGAIFGWPSFKDEISLIPGGYTFGINGVSIPPGTLGLPPPFILSGFRLVSDGDDGLTPVAYYDDQSLQLLTGYASNCMNNVPARYFPQYYMAQNSGLTLAQVLELPLDVTISTPCDFISMVGQEISDFFTNLLNKIFGTNYTSVNTLPFPEYTALPNTISQLPPQFPNYPAVDYCVPLKCSFVENGAFDFAVDMQSRTFRLHVMGMRDSLDRIRGAYSALGHDVLEAVQYYEKTR